MDQRRKDSQSGVLTGDIHSHWANELRIDDRDPDSPIVATEFVGSSISSGGNGQDKPKGLDQLMAANPGVKFHNQQRGYVLCTVTNQSWERSTSLWIKSQSPRYMLDPREVCCRGRSSQAASSVIRYLSCCKSILRVAPSRRLYMSMSNHFIEGME